MNQEQDKTCCAGHTAIIHLCNFIVSLAVSALSLGCLGLTLYVRFGKNAKEPQFVGYILELLCIFSEKWKGWKWGTVVENLSSDEQIFVWYAFLVSLFATGICALLSAIYSIVFLAIPHLHYAYYLSTWMYIGKLLLDGALIKAIIEDGRKEVPQEGMSKSLVLIICLISALFTITQLLLHIPATLMLCERNKSERSCCLPLNSTSDGNV